MTRALDSIWQHQVSRTAGGGGMYATHPSSHSGTVQRLERINSIQRSEYLSEYFISSSYCRKRESTGFFSSSSFIYLFIFLVPLRIFGCIQIKRLWIEKKKKLYIYILKVKSGNEIFKWRQQTPSKICEDLRAQKLVSYKTQVQRIWCVKRHK